MLFKIDGIVIVKILKMWLIAKNLNFSIIIKIITCVVFLDISIFQKI